MENPDTDNHLMTAVSGTSRRNQGRGARDVVPPSECSQAFDERWEEWRAHFRPEGPAEKVMIEQAVQASWRLDRCARSETARIAAKVRHAALDFQREAADRAEVLVRRLLFEPVDRASVFNPQDPLLRERLDRREEDRPSSLLRALQADAAGVDWLLAPALRNRLRARAATSHRFVQVAKGPETGHDRRRHSRTRRKP